MKKGLRQRCLPLPLQILVCEEMRPNEEGIETFPCLAQTPTMLREEMRPNEEGIETRDFLRDLRLAATE